MRPTDQLGAAALAYAQLGYRVLPLHHPVSRNAIQGRGMLCSCSDPACGGGQASPDPTRPEGRHQRPGPAGSMVATLAPGQHRLVTGEVADVLDIDGPAGRAAVRRFTADHDLRLEGPLVRTGSGWHLYLAPTGSGNRADLLEHVDCVAAATLSPHLLDMPAAAATGGCGHSPPNSPQHRRRCAASSTSPEPTQLSRFPRRRSARLLVAILTAAPR
jgi:hypothetical protein